MIHNNLNALQFRMIKSCRNFSLCFPNPDRFWLFNIHSWCYMYYLYNKAGRTLCAAIAHCISN